MLHRDGAIDFGAASQLRWRTNLREIAAAVNGRFKIHWNDVDSAEYRIVKIAALGAKDGRK